MGVKEAGAGICVCAARGFFVPSILIADDNTNIQKMVSLAFEDRGITVVSVGNGEAAVRRIPDLNPDLVLADIFMPVRNGYEVCEFVKKDQRFAHVPVILLVGAFDPLDEKEARRVGADGVLKKPFVPPDPLIAMVISALEKNPRVAAEMAKAKAALEQQSAPDAGASFEVQTLPKPEPKPLPHFPEPTPEEAALVYGFGKGVRTLDDEEQAGPAKEPPAPVAGAGEEDDDDFEKATDWRRNAMDFEIPDEAASRQAFSTIDELETARFFPSEAHVPTVKQRIERAFDAVPETIQRLGPPVSQEVKPPVPEAAELMPVETHAPVSLSKESEIPSPVSIGSREAASEPHPEPGREEKPSLASRMRHWMDALVSSPSHEDTKGSGDWMESISEPQTAEVAAVEQAPASPAAPDATAPAVVKPAEETFFAEEPEPAEATPIEAVSMEAVPSEIAGIEEAPIEVVPSAIETAEFTEAAGSDAAPLEQAPVAGASAEPTESAAPAPIPEIWDRDEETTTSFRDPELVEPEAVHVTPEPLLVDEGPQGPSNYGEHEPEVAAAQTFEVAVSQEPAVEDGTEEESFLPEPAFESAAVESVVEESDERIPTGPPPDRDALAEIPFLNPPQGFDPDAHAAPASPVVDASTVDAVVQRLLEKLQPQLHDLLSQGVLKPLVENLLQQELTKKDK